MDLLMDTKESQGRTPGFENAAPKKGAVLCHYHSLKRNKCHSSEQIRISLSFKIKPKKA